jgi:replicative DNA helicase
MFCETCKKNRDASLARDIERLLARLAADPDMASLREPITGARSRLLGDMYASLCAPQIFRELNPVDFYSTFCGQKYERLATAYNEGTLRETVKAMTDAGLPQIDEIVPVFDAVKVVRNHSIRRNVDLAISELSGMTDDYTNGVGAIQDKFKELAVNVMDSRVCKVPSFTKEDIMQYRAEIQNDTRAFVTGFHDVDRLAPIQPGDFVVIAARPSVGKSALATTMLIANFMGAARHRGIMMSIEMDLKQVYARLISQMSNVPLSKFLNRSDYVMTEAERNAAAYTEERIVKEFPERWFQQGTATLSEIQQVVELERPEFIMIDYVQIINHHSKHGSVDKLAEISVFLRQLALDYGVAVVAIAQLNRDSNGNAPQISHIKGSGQFEQDATHIFLLDRPESERGDKGINRNYFTKGNDKVDLVSQTGGITNLAALLLAKNRNGPTPYHLLNFNPKTTAFTSFE